MSTSNEKIRQLETLRSELLATGRTAEAAALDTVLEQARNAAASAGVGEYSQAPVTSPAGGSSKANRKTYLRLKKKYYTPAEVAKRVGVSRQTIVKWIERGELEAETTPGGHHRIPASVFQTRGRGDAIQLIPVEDE